MKYRKILEWKKWLQYQMLMKIRTIFEIDIEITAKIKNYDRLIKKTNMFWQCFRKKRMISILNFCRNIERKFEKSEKLIWNLNSKCYQFHYRCWKSRTDLSDKQMWFLKFFKKQKCFRYWYEIVDIENHVKKLINFLIRILMLSLKQKKNWNKCWQINFSIDFSTKKIISMLMCWRNIESKYEKFLTWYHNYFSYNFLIEILKQSNK